MCIYDAIYRHELYKENNYSVENYDKLKVKLEKLQIKYLKLKRKYTKIKIK